MIINFKDFFILNESIKGGRKYLDNGSISLEDFDYIISIDPSKNKKYVGWLTKMFVQNNDIKYNMKSIIEEYDVLSGKGKSKTKDVYAFKSFEEMSDEVNRLNNIGDNLSIKDLENDYETVIDNDDILVQVPHTHEASRKLGLTTMSYRNCGDDSSWCTTYKAPNHFNDYYYSNNVTFYYIKIKSDELFYKIKQEFNREAMVVMALALTDGNKIDGYDGNDTQISENDIKRYRDIIGI